MGNLLNNIKPATSVAKPMVAAIAFIVLSCSSSAADVATKSSELEPSPQPVSEVTSTEGQDYQAVLAAQQEALNVIYDSTLPSVVHIRVVTKVEQPANIFPFDSPFGFGPAPGGPDEFFQEGEGSGFVWDTDGHILTNHHVIANADEVDVVFADGTRAEAEITGSDPDSDLAVLKLTTVPDALTPLALGDSSSIEVGDISIAMGNPFGQEFTMTTGIVSALGRTIRGGASGFSIPEVIQTDAAINPGNSGGPLLDFKGRVIGINTQIISRSGSSAGIGFAVPINTAKRVVPALIEDGVYEYAYLGISGTSLEPEIAEAMALPDDTRGALVIQIVDGGPADKAGLRGSDKTTQIRGADTPLGGDVITHINGNPVNDMDDLITYLSSSTRPGDVVELTVIRDDGTVTSIKVTLTARPKSDSNAR